MITERWGVGNGRGEEGGGRGGGGSLGGDREREASSCEIVCMCVSERVSEIVCMYVSE